MSKNEVVMNPRKVAVVGCGFVGSASAFALMQSGLFSEMVLIDANFEKAETFKFDKFGKHSVSATKQFKMALLLVLE